MQVEMDLYPMPLETIPQITIIVPLDESYIKVAFGLEMYGMELVWKLSKVPYTTVNNKKTRTPCFSTLRFSRISPEPIDLQKIYLHF